MLMLLLDSGVERVFGGIRLSGKAEQVSPVWSLVDYGKRGKMVE